VRFKFYPPEQNTQKVYWDWMKKVLAKAGFRPKVTIENPQKGLYHKGHELAGEKVLFFTNTYRNQSLAKKITYDLGDKGLWKWNPETGERTPYNLSYDANGFELYLRPLESILLVTGEKQLPTQKYMELGEEVLQIKSDWQLEFMPVNSTEKFTISSDSLIEFTTYPDSNIQRFSGVVNYTTTFSLNKKIDLFLDLGQDNDFISEVELNGKAVGVNWYGSKLFDVSDFVQEGENALSIKYTTTLWNTMRDTEQGTMFINKYRRPIPPLKSSGLLGPVRLLEAK